MSPQPLPVPELLCVVLPCAPPPCPLDAAAALPPPGPEADSDPSEHATIVPVESAIPHAAIHVVVPNRASICRFSSQASLLAAGSSAPAHISPVDHREVAPGRRRSSGALLA